MAITIYTVGHSNLNQEEFVELLKKHHISVVIDVRSQPFSSRFPHFNKHELQTCLEKFRIFYNYRGDKLGGRPKNPALYKNQRISYELIGRDKEFIEALNELISLAIEKKIALMCSEKDPIECHRGLLIGRNLKDKGVSVQHILSDGSLESQEDLEKRMMRESPDQLSFFMDDEKLKSAYRRQEEKIMKKLVKKDESYGNREKR